MKFLSRIFSLIVLILITESAEAQGFKNNVTQYKIKLISEASSLIGSEDVLSTDEMKPQFKRKGYAPVDVDLKSMKKRKLSPAKIYERVSVATVIVSPAGRCNEVTDRGACKRIHTYPASGYIIDSSGIIVTNYHVVNSYISKYNKDARDVFVVMLKDGTSFPVQEILMADKSEDLAVIRIDPKGTELPVLPVATKDAEIGDPVYIVSHPKGYFYAFSSGMVTDKFSEINASNYRNLMAISADYAAGSSGAAIIDESGNVIGTVSYTKTFQHSGDETKTQMVLKATIPSSSLLRLINEGNL
ncbi:S1 family peptidase [Aestuariibaculum sediminum]|uniref:Trypsin-like peptidase domain-containing protein n=1 Tax=Aestuariibaculum sediminum TaxID=2770637 RepID=A0A8J6Q8U7_9FLAO|nr:serine protease [Aestuariibaculum sediminum]MBD0833403.1 trypsin-like peptidase domain-containing protein [Aestuariibaculum sediminum]